MNKLGDMTASIAELRNAAAAINGVADWLTEAFCKADPTVDALATERLLTLEEVRAVLAEKSDTKTVAKLKAAIEAAYHEGESKLKGNGKTVPPLAAIKSPLRDGDVERPDDPAYANAYFINANSATAPGIVDADRNPVITRSEVYSGVYGRASINLYAFNSNGNKGIACGLNNLQLIRDGEPLGGKTSAENDFASDDDSDFLN